MIPEPYQSIMLSGIAGLCIGGAAAVAVQLLMSRSIDALRAQLSHAEAVADTRMHEAIKRAVDRNRAVARAEAAEHALARFARCRGANGRWTKVAS